MSEKKVLILSCNTGGGHNAAGKAICQELVSRDVQCEMVDFLALTSPIISKSVCKSYIGIVKKVPRLFGVMYKSAGKDRFKRVKSVSYFVNSWQRLPLRHLIEDNGYNVVVMPHIFPSQGLTNLVKHKGTKVLSLMIGTDYDYVPYSTEVHPDYFVLPHGDITQQYVDQGIDKDKLLPFGIPVSAQFKQRIDKENARKSLGLAEDRPCVLIMSGSMGYGDADMLISGLIKKYGDTVSVVLLGGNNKKLKENVRNTYKENKNVTVVDFTTKVSLYMDAADVILTKPGGLTTTEFAVKNVPAILTKPIPGCETRNAAFFTSRGMALQCLTVEDQLAGIEYLLKNEDARKAMMRAQQDNINPNSAKDICDFILSH